jgi:hypothetical protein
MAGGKRIESRQIAEYIGHQAEGGENLMREVSTLLNTNQGPQLKDQVFQDMVKLQNEGKLPGLVFTDSRGRPITNPGDSGSITSIKAKGSGETVYKMGDFYKEQADRADKLKEMPGFSEQYKDTRRNSFDVAQEQARQQAEQAARQPANPQERVLTPEQQAQKKAYENCTNVGQTDIKMGHTSVECSATTGYKPDGVKTFNVSTDRVDRYGDKGLNFGALLKKD